MGCTPLKQEQLNRRIRRLISDLSLPYAVDREHAAYELGVLGADAKVAIPSLVKALRDLDIHVREKAAQSLGEIGAATQETVDALIATYQEECESSSVQWEALIALGQFGVSAQTATPYLINTLKISVDSGIIRHAATALGRINPELATKNPDFNKFVNSVIEKLHLDFEKSDSWMGHHSGILGEIGPAAKEAVPHLISLLQMFIKYEKFNYSCNRVVEALGKIGPAAKEAVPCLIELLEQKSTPLGIEATTALGNIRAKSPDVITALENAYANGDYYVRKAAEEALKKILSEEEESCGD